MNNIFVTIYSHIGIAAHYIVFCTIVEDDFHTCSRSIEPPAESDLGAIGIHLVVEAIRIRVHTSSVSSLCAIESRISTAIWCRSWIWSWFFLFLVICASGEEYFSIRCLIGSYSDVLGIFLITISSYSDGISTWCKVLIYKYTIVVIISSVALLVFEHTRHIIVAISHNGIARSIGQIDFCAVDRHIDIITCATRIVGLVDFFLFGTHITHDITFGLRSSTIPRSNTTIVTQTLLAAPIRIECTVASWLIGMEVSFNQITRNTMAQHAIIACITHAINRGCRALSAPKSNISI